MKKNVMLAVMILLGSQILCSQLSKNVRKENTTNSNEAKADDNELALPASTIIFTMVGSTSTLSAGRVFIASPVTIVSDEDESENAESNKESDDVTIPAVFALYDNYPNPFNPTTTIRYDLPQDAHVSISVFNILGQQVATIVDEAQNAGSKTVVFDASTLPSGVYLCQIRTEDVERGAIFMDTSKMLLMK